MKPLEFLYHLNSLGVKVWADSDKLRYSAPKGVLTPEMRNSLVEHKENLLSFFTIKPTLQNREEGLPLSFAQQRLWFIDQLEPDSNAYNVPVAVRFKGNLDVEALEASFNEIVRRHEALRTSFLLVEGRPLQLITPELNLSIPVVDLSAFSEAEREQEAINIATQEAQRPFDLRGVPLIRVKLLKLQEQEQILLVTMHHIISDGWSMGVFIRELTTLYEAYSNDRPSPLTDLSIQYADFAYWQREWLEEVIGKQLSYWKKQLAGVSGLQLPIDHPRPAIQTFNGAAKTFVLKNELLDELKALSNSNGVTLFMTLLAAFKVLLSRYSGQQDIAVGTPIANRNRAEIESLIGFFVNSLVLRTDLSDNPSFEQLLVKVREVALGAYQNQDIPFEKLVEELQPKRDMSTTPLFQVLFVLQNSPLPKLVLGDLEITPFAVESGIAKFDISLAMEETTEGLAGSLEYNTDLFEPTTIRRMVSHFQRLLEAIAADPTQQISGLPMLSEAEHNQLLVEWNNTATDYPADKCIHQLFEQQVELTPDAVALVYEDQSLTYRELNSRANQLAHYLQTMGVGPDVQVGICVERSVEMVVGLFGILKAGGAYLPLDPSYPKDRLAFMFEDSKLSLVLTQQRFVDALPVDKSSLICLDTQWSTIASSSDHNPGLTLAGNNLAYTIYTSGSTGRPKGAMNSHEAILNRLLWMQEAYQLDESDCVLQKTPFSFDVSVWEFFWPLMFGARLVVAKPGGHQDSSYLVDLIAREKVTTLHFVPSMLQIFVEEEGLERCESIKRVICSGEALPFELQQRFFSRLSAQLHNLYGPTEAAVDVSYWACKRNDSSKTVPIGRPIANIELYILDKNMQPVPAGVAGELHIGGIGLARGYFNRPALTAEKFIPNPFSTEGGERLYKTGDLARHLPDGNIEYLGRIDNQVKIRGFRIELGEIEAALAKHPAINESVVIAREDEPGGKRLVAYLVCKQDSEISITELRSFLKDSLPEYMVPAIFVQLDSLPLSPNGKIDRRALPVPDSSRSELMASYTAPTNTEEEIMVRIWEKVLGLEQVGIDDGFFEIGGDSIRSIQALSQARERGLNFSLQQIFQHQTVRGLVEQIKSKDQDATLITESAPFDLINEQDRLKLPADVEDAYPLTKLQEGMLFHSDLSSATYHDVFSFHLRATLDEEQLRKAAEYLISRHPILRTSFDFMNYSEPLQLVHKSTEAPLFVEDLSHLSNEEQEEEVVRWVEAEKQRVFDRSEAPLMRLQIHKRSEERFQFSLSFHHAILDGWSVATLLTGLFQQYYYLLGKISEKDSAAPTAPFRDFVSMERAVIESEKAKQYWQEKLSDITISELPRWNSAQAKKGKQDDYIQQAQVAEVGITQEVSDGLKRLARMAAVPIKTVLLAAHLRVMSLLSGQGEIVTGLVSNGRLEAAGGERTLGLFLNTLPYCQKLGSGSWLSLVKETFENEKELIPYRRYPLSELQRENKRGDLFETAFNFIHFHVYRSLQHLPGIEVINRHLFEQTNFTLVANFGLDILSSKVEFSLEYNANELGEEQVRAIGSYYEKVLTLMASDPAGSYEEQSLLPDQEYDKVVVEWNDTAADYPADKCIHQLFEEQVERTPDAVALVYQDQSLTYRELNSRANQLAHYLQSMGVGPDVQVGICVERSIEMVVGLLAVLKAGGAYLPLDPSYPKDRLSFILDDSKTPVVLTHQHIVDALFDNTHLNESVGAGLVPARIADRRLSDNGRQETIAQARFGQGQALPLQSLICIDTQWKDISQQSGENLNTEINPNNLAYIIYTSGSTGKPKGVEIEHSSLANLVSWHQNVYKLQPSDRATQIASPAFDASVWELWPYLTIGASIHIVDEQVKTSPQELVEWLAAEAITICFLPTPLAQAVFQYQWPQDSVLRTMLVGGDKLDKVPASMPFSLANNYGPTENTVVTSWAWITEENIETLPIGCPVSNTKVYILDTNMQAVPVGVAGELHIGGESLARGYFNRPELTAEKFIPNPFSAEGGERLYRTGDLARYLPDGNIEYLGRIDNQVKIRGFRIELGEIEAVLAKHPAINEAVVIAREDEPGDKRLVAYLVSKLGSDVSMAELRTYLQEKLPVYMVPSAFVKLDAMPVTPNGKVDQRKLESASWAPTTIGILSEDRSVQIPPRDIFEHQLSHIWEELLNVRPIGVTDNFFDLGGHSLLAVRMMAYIQKQFGQALPLSILLEEATIEHLARALRQKAVSSSGSSLVGINPNGSKRPFFCVHPAGGNVFCYIELAQLLGADQPFYGFQSAGLNGEQEPFSTIEEMASHYIEALRTIQPEGPYLIGGWSFGGVVAFEMAQQLRRQNHEVSLALLDTQTPLYKYEQVHDDAWIMMNLIKDQNLSVSYDDLRGQDLNEQLNYVLEFAKKANRFPSDLDMAQIRYLAQVYKANLRAVYNYTPEIYEDKITIFRASERPAGILEDQPLAKQLLQDPTFGWSKLSSQPVEVEPVPGTHESLVLKPYVEVLADRLKNYLDSAFKKEEITTKTQRAQRI